jgi:hypothetical protein
MFSTFLGGLFALTVSALVGSVALAYNGGIGCASPSAGNGVVMNVALADAPFAIHPIATNNDVSDGTIRLSQTLGTRPTGQSRLPRRVPRGQTYHIQREGERGFDSFSAGTTLPTVDCVEIVCPATFPPSATCWRCIKQAE